jgi:cytochrome P450 PksS
MNAMCAVDIASPAFKRDPYPFYERLRERRSAARIRLADGGSAWLFARYDDVAAMLKDPRFAKDPRNAPAASGASIGPKVPAFLKPLTQNMLERDDPDHARLRMLIHATFTPGRVALLRARTEATAEALLDRLEKLDRIDLIAAFAIPLPVIVISELLGVPRADRRKFARWSHTLMSVTSSKLRMLTALPDLWAFVHYLRGLIVAKRADPGDDLTTALLDMRASAGRELDGEELLAMLALLLTAGHETTANLIGNGMFALLRHPDQLERLRAESERIPVAIEEILRYESPVATTTNRFARTEMEFGGQAIALGDRVIGAITSANRDSSRFPSADTFDIARDPNRHLTFGQGGHYCIGAPLARLEGEISITALLRRFRRIDAVDARGAGMWRRGMVLRGLVRLPIRVRR